MRVETGVFQAHMSLEIVNDGPVTILLDSDKVFLTCPPLILSSRLRYAFAGAKR